MFETIHRCILVFHGSGAILLGNWSQMAFAVVLSSFGFEALSYCIYTCIAKNSYWFVFQDILRLSPCLYWSIVKQRRVGTVLNGRLISGALVASITAGPTSFVRQPLNLGQQCWQGTTTLMNPVEYVECQGLWHTSQLGRSKFQQNATNENFFCC